MLKDPGLRFVPSPTSRLAHPAVTRPMTATETNWTGRILDGRFRIDAALANGGMGAVFLATQLELQRNVVIKVVRADLARDHRTVERFRRETQVVAQLSHPNIVDVYHAGQTPEGALYLVMERVAGDPLSAVLRNQGSLDARRALTIAEQVAAGLAAAHARGIIHRDLKPSNLMISALPGRQDHVTILDFGIARLQERDANQPALTDMGLIVGTPAWMSPEQVAGEELDGRSDLYALGLVLYEMLSGSHPWPHADATQLCQLHLRADIPPLPSVRGADLEALRPLVARLTARHRETRPTDAEDARLLIQRTLETIRSQSGARDGMTAHAPGSWQPPVVERSVISADTLLAAAAPEAPARAGATAARPVAPPRGVLRTSSAPAAPPDRDPPEVVVLDTQAALAHPAVQKVLRDREAALSGGSLPVRPLLLGGAAVTAVAVLVGLMWVAAEGFALLAARMTEAEGVTEETVDEAGEQKTSTETTPGEQTGAAGPDGPAEQTGDAPPEPDKTVVVATPGQPSWLPPGATAHPPVGTTTIWSVNQPFAEVAPQVRAALGDAAWTWTETHDQGPAVLAGAALDETPEWRLIRVEHADAGTRVALFAP